MTTADICTIAGGVISVGTILIYVGRSLGTLQKIDQNQEVLFNRTTEQGKEIARIDKELTLVKTRQEDCENCP